MVAMKAAASSEDIAFVRKNSGKSSSFHGNSPANAAAVTEPQLQFKIVKKLIAGGLEYCEMQRLVRYMNFKDEQMVTYNEVHDYMHQMLQLDTKDCMDHAMKQLEIRQEGISRDVVKQAIQHLIKLPAQTQIVIVLKKMNR